MALSDILPVNVLAQEQSDWFAVWNADSVEILRGLPEASVHYSIFSPPFQSLFTYSDNMRDLSNNRGKQVFWDHYRFILAGVFRAIKPGRLVSIHCMDLPTSITVDGFIGMEDFPGDNIRAAQAVGFIYHSRVCIRKDPVAAMQRSKSIGLLHKQMVKDSALSRMGMADTIITVRKPGTNDEPVQGVLDLYYGDDLTDKEQSANAAQSYRVGEERSWEVHKSIEIWQRYAEPVWMDIVQGDVLSHRVAREEHDERHISPLQLTPVRRCIDLWTNPGDVVLSPFAGIGTAGYVAIEMGRRFVGAELKPSYYRQCVANLRLAEAERERMDLFDGGETANAGLFEALG